MLPATQSPREAAMRRRKQLSFPLRLLSSVSKVLSNTFAFKAPE